MPSAVARSAPFTTEANPGSLASAVMCAFTQHT